MTTQSMQGVTLEEVFAALAAKRVPMAPELAGYLTLGVAEGCPSATLALEARMVWVGDDGSVSLVVPRGTAQTGDADAIIRGFLGGLLEASGQKTPALTATARRRSGSQAHTRSLADEIVSALIPVNRAAGRRALARLAREVQRAGVLLSTQAPSPGLKAPVQSATPPRVLEAPAALPLEAPARISPPIRTLGEDERTPPPRAVMSAPAAKVVSARLGAPPLVDAMPAFEIEQAPVAAPTPIHAFAHTPPMFDALHVQPNVTAAHVAHVDRGLPRDAAANDDSIDVDVDFEPNERVVEPISLEASERNWVPIPDHGYDDFDLVGGVEANAGPISGAALSPIPSKFVTLSDPLLPAFHVAPPSDRHLSQELRALVGVDETPNPASESPVEGPTSDFTDALAGHDDAAFDAFETRPLESDLVSSPESDSLRPFARDSEEEEEEGDRHSTTAPARLPRMKIDAPLPTFARSRSANFVRTAALVASASLATVSILWAVVGRGGFQGSATSSSNSATHAEESSALFSMERAPACHATLTVADVPAHAEVLLRLGQAPLDVERMPMGARLEFVALADGFAPRRAIVPANATWESDVQNRPRFELGVQLDAVKSRTQADTWPAFETGTEVGGKGTPGTVHVVASPKGAEVWLLAGLGPEAHIEQLGCGSDVDVLVAGPGSFRKRIHVPASDFTVEGPPGKAKSELRLARASVGKGR